MEQICTILLILMEQYRTVDSKVFIPEEEKFK